MFQVKVIEDSISAYDARLTTIEATYPRFIHSEILTHRDRARNSASSRAIPWPKMMARIVDNPVIPIQFGAEQKGMQTGDEIDNRDEAVKVWLKARDSAVDSAKRLADLGVHKSICNRITEPWMWITVVMTATEWANFFRLRCHPDAEIHFQKIAGMIRDALEESTPTLREHGDWHLPYVSDEERKEYGRVKRLDNLICKVSAARCARVSYLTHDGKRSIQADLDLFDRLTTGSGFGHWSPMEHVARPSAKDRYSGPFRGWRQFRKDFPLECA